MALPQNWQAVQGKPDIYENKEFTVDGSTYKIEVNSKTGAMYIYGKDTLGDKLFATSTSKNDLAIVDKNVFLRYQNLSAQELAKKFSTEKKITDYFNNNITLPANQYRANLINNLYPNNTAPFDEMPGVKNAPMAQSTITTIQPFPTNGPGTGNVFVDVINSTTILAQNPLTYVNDLTFNSDNDSLFAGKSLKYPFDILDKQQDCLIIQQNRYKPPYEGIYSQDNFEKIIKEGLERGKDWQEVDLGRVILPMPSTTQDANGVSWGSDNAMGATTGAAISEVANNFPSYSGSFLAGKFLDSLIGQGNTSTLAPQLLFLMKLAGAGANSPNFKATLGTSLLSDILNKVGYEVSPESILSRGYGIIPNSNVELLFNGVTLRTFQFSYRMSPRNQNEAKEVRKIIRFFKQGMSARKQNNTSSSIASFFLGTPNIFRLKYTYDSTNPIKGVNKFKTCALQNFSVNYSPDGQWNSYVDDKAPGQPISVIISMNFCELDPIYNQDYDPKVDDEVGY